MSDESKLAETLTALLVHIIRAALPADEDARVAPRREAARLHHNVQQLLTTEDPGAVALDGLWARAVVAAEDEGLDARPLKVSKQLPAACPIGFDDLNGTRLDLPDLENRIRLSAATG